MARLLPHCIRITYVSLGLWFRRLLGAEASGPLRRSAGCKFPYACTFFAVLIPEGAQGGVFYVRIRNIWIISNGKRYAVKVLAGVIGKVPGLNCAYIASVYLAMR